MNILSFLIAVVVLVIILKLISLPFKIIIKLIVNSFLGGIILYACNMIGLGIIVEWWSILLTGFLGIPGLIISFIISILI